MCPCCQLVSLYMIQRKFSNNISIQKFSFLKKVSLISSFTQTLYIKIILSILLFLFFIYGITFNTVKICQFISEFFHITNHILYVSFRLN